MGIKAKPYNGEFEGECDLRIAKENPDIIVENSFKSLCECKSEKEWGEKLKFDKRVIGEFNSYQEYAEDIEANSVLFVCEAKFLDEDRYLNKFIENSYLNKLLIVNNRMLLHLKNHRNKIKKFKEKIKFPTKYEMKDRLMFKVD